MKVTLIDLLDSLSTLEWMAGQRPGTRAAFQIGRALRPVLREAQAALATYNETRLAMLARYSAVAPEGGLGEYSFPLGNKPEFQREHRELVATELALDLAPLPFALFEPLPWTAGLASTVYWLFDDLPDKAEA